MEQRRLLEKLLRDSTLDFCNREIIVWGTGNTACLAQQGIKRFAKEHPWFSISAYCDSAEQKWGTSFYGKPIISPNQLYDRALNGAGVMICAQTPGAVSSIRSRLMNKNIPVRLLDEVILKTEAEKVLYCYDLLEDAASRDTYFSIINGRVLGMDFPKVCSEPKQYFAHPALRESRPPEVFIDCGAYIGDTLEELLCNKNGQIKKYIAFESNAENYQILCENAKKMKEKWLLQDESVSLYNVAVGEHEGKVSYSHDDKRNGAAAMIIAGNDTAGEIVQIVTLDHFLREPYTFLKADIESYEYSMLQGAKQSIQRNKPLMAICIYHNAVDLYSIPILIQELVSEYHFSVKHHSPSNADPYADTVLYCWCED